MSAPALFGRYELTRFLYLRLLGLLYAIGFLILVNQGLPLIGHDGLLPADQYLRQVHEQLGGAAYWRVPTLFWLDVSDAALRVAAFTGLLLSLFVLAGFANVPMLFSLWLLYSSFVNAGQLFYGYGWEILLLEMGFLALFLAPLKDVSPFPANTKASPLVMLLLRWLLFRLMFGAGLIKLRGDPCWRELTCMLFHYETQPVPNPLSWYFHQLPAWFHQLEVGFNHVVELIAPWLLFAPRRARHAAGALQVLFQLLLIASGNLAFLNWLTLTVAIACFDDALLAKLLPAALVRRAAAAPAQEGKARGMTLYALAVVVALLSVNPVTNMLSPGQVMNTSFDPLNLVNSYGAFGSVGRERYEIVIEGTAAETPGEDAQWLAYEFECKPGDVSRRPCWMSPYHYRIDWQMWFAAMSEIRNEPWLIHFAAKLLEGDPGAQSLLARSPFPGAPPRFVRAELYRYEFTRRGEDTRAWWRRRYVGHYLPALARDDRALREALRLMNWAR